MGIRVKADWTDPWRVTETVGAGSAGVRTHEGRKRITKMAARIAGDASGGGPAREVSA